MLFNFKASKPQLKCFLCFALKVMPLATHTLHFILFATYLFVEVLREIDPLSVVKFQDQEVALYR